MRLLRHPVALFLVLGTLTIVAVLVGAGGALGPAARGVTVRLSRRPRR